MAQEHATISLPQEIDVRTLLDLTVPVEIPQMHVVFTACLDLPSYRTGIGEARCAAIDQSLLAELSLRYSRYWDVANGTSTDDPVDVTYEMQANPDVWLVGGQRKAHFTAKVRLTRYYISRPLTNIGFQRRQGKQQGSQSSYFLRRRDS